MSSPMEQRTRVPRGASLEGAVARAARRVLPWMSDDGGSPAHVHTRRVARAAVRAAIVGALHLVPLMSDESLISIFDRSIRECPTPERQEFIRQGLVTLKRLLSSPQHKDAATRLLNTVLSQQFEINDRRKMFRETHGSGPPSLIVISPSMRCNLRCYGCYAGEYNRADDLPYEVIDKVIKEVRDMGVFFVVVSGGEPFFSQDVMRMWEENPNILFLVYTNGTLIEDAMARKLAKMGNVFPAISVEGFEAETDARRGKGTFAKIMQAMDNLNREQVIFGFSATAIRGNSEIISSPEFVDFYIQKGCLFGWYFNYIPIGREPDLELMPTPEQRVARWHRVAELRRTKPIMLADFWCDGALTGGCIAGGRSYLHINSKGDVEPCVFAHFAVDNIRDKSLVEALSSPFFRAIRSRQPYSENLFRPCMIIDNPEVLRTVVNEGKAHPTHAGAETIIGQLAGDLDDYARRYAELADREWSQRQPQD